LEPEELRWRWLKLLDRDSRKQKERGGERGRGEEREARKWIFRV
jgi:hypothetical protein